VIRSFVADASVAIGWVHPAQATGETAAMLDAVVEGAKIDVPALWPLEVANALAVLVRRRKLTTREHDLALGWLRALPVRVDHEGAALAFSRLSEIATVHGLTVYDAAYLELAMRSRRTLACKDGPLRDAAERLGVPLWS
jgi:uncharacterized protein (TIGR03382 family)